MRGLGAGILVAAAALVAPAAAQAADVTPDGPATLTQRESGCAYPAIGLSPATLTAVEVRVGDGSRAGRIRLQLQGQVVSDWYDLPAAAGTYVVPTRGADATYLALYQGTGLGLEQEAGGHAVLTPEPSYASGTDGTTGQVLSRCERHVDVTTPDGATSAIADTRLALRPITEPDQDGDGVPDSREGTDLAVTLGRGTSTATSTGVVARIVNRGPQAARAAAVGVSGTAPGADVRFGIACDTSRAVFGVLPPSSTFCPLGAIPPGGSIDVPIALPAAAAPGAVVQVGALGPDPTPGDNAAPVAPALPLPPAPQLTLLGPAARVPVGAPVRLRVRSDRAGTFALTATVALRGGRTLRLPSRTLALAEDVRRVVTLRLTAAQARSLRRALAPGRTATATVTLAGSGAAPRTIAVRLRAPR